MEDCMTDFRQIVWLASYPKSGNTWVRLFLDAYFLGDLDINEIVCSVGDDGIQRYNVGDGSPIHAWPVDIQQLARPMAMLRTVTSYLTMPDPKPPLFVKTHQANVIANGVELLPEALTKAMVYLVRDPCDVMPSFANHIGVDHADATEKMQNKYQLLAAAEYRVADYLSSWDAHVEAAMTAKHHNTFIVRYEDLRADPVTWFTRILEHSGVDPDPERVRAAAELTELSKLRKREQDEGFKEGSEKAKEQFFNTGQVGKKINPMHRARLERAFRKTLNKLERHYGT